jgi:hypothetical protein
LSTYEALGVLGLEQQATAAEIKMAYRDQVKQWHPDQFGADPERSGEAEGRLIELNRAYNVLQSYDRGPDVVQLNGTVRSDVKPKAFHLAPMSLQNGHAKRSGWSIWIRGVWVCVLVAVISAIGFRLNRFVADDNDLAQAASAASAASPATNSKIPAMPAPVIASALPVAATAIKTPVMPAPVSAPASPVIASTVPVTATVPSRAMPSVPPARPVLASMVRGKHAATVTDPPPSDPDVPDLTLGERLDLRTKCLSEAGVEDTASYQACFLRKLEEHPRPIHLAEPGPSEL